MKLSKSISKLLIAVILLSCFVSLYQAEPGAGVVLGKAVFHETGLTSGTLWKVSLSGTNYTSTTDTITVNNIGMGAVVSWIVYVPTGYTSNSTLTGGYQQTAGEQHDFYVNFASASYNVVFGESGLSSGINWAVTFNGVTKTSSDSAITFTNVAGGSYNYTVNAPTGYSSSVTSGQLSVSNDEQVSTVFTQLDSWWTIGNGPTHTGYSVSNGPISNSTLWTQSFGMFSDMGSESNPAIVDGIMYLTTGDFNNLYIVNATTGDLINTITSITLSYYSSPTIVNGIIYIGSQNHAVYALNATTGSTIWSYMTGDFLQGSPVVANGVLYIGSADDYLYSLNATDGTLLWSYKTIGDVWRTPTVANGIVYAVSFTPEAGAISALNATNGQVIWNYSSASYFINVPVIGDGILYTCSRASSDVGNILAFNSTTGSMIWNNTKVSWATAALAHGIVYFAATDRNFYAFNATTGDQIWATPFTGLSPAQPCIANDIVYYKTDRQVCAFDAFTGETLWTYALDMMLTMEGRDSIISIANGILYVPLGRSYVYAFGTFENYTLTINTVGHGTVSPSSQTQTYQAGAKVDLIAVPDDGWTFAGWSGNASGITNTTITMDDNKTVTATFTQNIYTLTTLTIGTGNVSPANQTFHYGDNVTIQAMSQQPWTFSGWNGSGITGSTNQTIFITGNMTITATFAYKSYNISVIQGRYGSITPDTTAVADGSNQSFSVQPDTGYHIEDVIVDGVSAGAVTSYEFTNVQEAHNITAAYELNDYTLTINTVGNGTVTRTPENANYQYGDSVQLSAVPDNGWVFSGWSGDASGTTDATIVIDGNKNVTATFTALTYQVNFTLSGINENYSGTVLTVDGVGYSMADLPKSFTWEYGSTHTYSFDTTLPIQTGERYSWNSTTGLSTTQSGSYLVTADGVIATTYNTQYLLTVTSTKDTPSGNGWYNAGITATASISSSMISTYSDTRSTFKGWTGDASGAQTSISVLMDQPRTVTANWKKTITKKQ